MSMVKDKPLAGHGGLGGVVYRRPRRQMDEDDSSSDDAPVSVFRHRMTDKPALAAQSKESQRNKIIEQDFVRTYGHTRNSTLAGAAFMFFFSLCTYYLSYP